MRRPRFIIIDGKSHLWRDILALRQAQCTEPKAAQSTLFPLKDDARPATDRTAAGRYREPGLFDGRSVKPP
jgi:hypothetical protein